MLSPTRRRTTAFGALALCCLLITAGFPSPAAAAPADLGKPGLGFGLASIERLLIGLFQRLGEALVPIDDREGATLVNGGAPVA